MSKSSAQKQTKRSTKLLARFLAASLVIAFFGGVQCVYAADSMDGSLTKLEDKFFQHNYPKDAVGDRLERLEKLMYGESKTGSDDERLKTLMNLVPNLDEKVDDGASAAPKAQTPAPAPRRQVMKPEVPQVDTSSAEPSPNDSSYPAVTAMEKKLLGRDYIGESVGKRLDRLEIKAYGKTAASEDLQDRVDRLKSSTGIDVAKVKPANSEWADEDEDPSGGVQPFTGIGSGDDPNSQRNMRKQASNSFNRPSPSYDPYAGTGTFGAGGSSHSVSSGSSGSFGTGAGTYRPDPMPATAPDYSQGGSSAPIPAPTMGVRQQISLLEREVFKKTYDNETLLSRLSRLEQTVFPQDKAASDKSLPERMNHLLAAVPISQATEPPVAPAPKRKRGGDPD
ncbi:MAG: hypothetical protein K2X81_09125, partial [Candidatus Obscuribacterales bacterium]|nr:hypothetical protein [Candidatus Obscuribacterales bacterium]